MAHKLQSIRQSKLGAGIKAAYWLELAGWVQLPCQLNLVNFAVALLAGIRWADLLAGICLTDLLTGIAGTDLLC